MFEFAWPWVFILLPLPLLTRKLLPPAKPLTSAVKVPFYAELSHRGAGEQRNPLNLLFLSLIWLLLVTAAAPSPVARRADFSNQQCPRPAAGSGYIRQHGNARHAAGQPSGNAY